VTALDAVRRRQSWSKVTPQAPTREELLPLIEAAGRVADHSSLRPWRLIELRGDDRVALGAAIGEAENDEPSTKPLRAALLIAIVASYRPSEKVPRWEQEAVASGVAHVLSLLLDEAGWGVIWRTGRCTRADAVARVHGLGPDEELLGWLYVGGKPEGKDAGRRRTVDADAMLTRMPRVDSSEGAGSALTDEERSAEQARKREKKAAKKAKKATEKARKREKKAARKLRKAARD